MDLYTGTPFWSLRSGLLNTYPSLRADAHADVVVIGAGVTGACVAHSLAKAGLDVIVLEGHDVVSGSSSATTGLLLYDTDTSLAELSARVGLPSAIRAYELGRAAIDQIAELANEVGECGFARRPNLYFASRARDVAALMTECDTRKRHGFACEWVTAGDISERYPFAAHGAIYGHDAAEIDCYRFTHGVLRIAASAGARVFDRTPVIDMKSSSTGVSMTTAAGHRVTARRVVCATGYEASLHAPRKVGRLSSTWAFVSEPVDAFPGWPDRCLIWETARPYIYIRTTDDGRVLVGGEDEPSALEHRSARKFNKKTATLLARVRKMFPEIPIDVAYRWAGTFSSTEDGLPYIGEMPECPNVWYALGYGGNGITFSMIAANIIRGALTGAPHPDARLFAFERTNS